MISNVVRVTYIVAIVLLLGALFRVERSVSIALIGAGIVAHLGLLLYFVRKAREMKLDPRSSPVEVVLKRFVGPSAATRASSTASTSPPPAPGSPLVLPDVTEEFTLFLDLLPESPWKMDMKACAGQFASSEQRLSVMNRTLNTLVLEINRAGDPNPANALAPVSEKIQYARDMVAAIYLLMLQIFQKAQVNIFTGQVTYNADTKKITLQGNLLKSVSEEWSKVVAYYPTLPDTLKQINVSQPISIPDFILLGLWSSRRDLETDDKIGPTFFQCAPCATACTNVSIPNPYKGNINAPHGTMPVTPTAAPTAAPR